MTTLSALPSWVRVASGDMSASAPSASKRVTTSTLLFAWIVPQPPSWPVLSAESISRTSAPRTSPTTRRSGRIRRLCRTRATMSTCPLPSTLAGRVCSRTVCGCTTASSRTSSTTTIRSPTSTPASSAASRVVLPEPVPPLTTKECRPATIAASTWVHSCGKAPAAWSCASELTRRRGMRRLMWAPPSTSGGRRACSRTPPGSSPSTYGLASSSRRRARPASRTARRRTFSSSPSSQSAWVRPAPLSIHTPAVPLTSTSVTSSRARSGSRGPAPSTSELSRAAAASTPPRPRTSEESETTSSTRRAVGP